MTEENLVIRPLDVRTDAIHVQEMQRLWRSGMRGIPRAAIRIEFLGRLKVWIAFFYVPVLGIFWISGVLSYLITLFVILLVPPILVFGYFYYCNTLYINRSLKDDWPDLEKAYRHPGCLWLALDRQSDGSQSVIGMVGLDANGYPLSLRDQTRGTYMFQRYSIDRNTSEAIKRIRGMELRRLCVRSDHRRNGLARRLVDTVIQHAKHNGADYVYLSMTQLQPAAERFYCRYGFKWVGIYKARQFLWIPEMAFILQD